MAPSGAHAQSIAQQPISSFSADRLALIDALFKLAQERHLPMGIEYVDEEALQKPVRIRLGETTLGAALDAILAQGKGYRWRIQDGVIVVGHSSVPSGEQNLLDRVLPGFAIPNCTLGEANRLLRSAVELELDPRIRGWVGDYPGGESGKRIGPLELHNVTVRSALNRLVSEHKNAAWIVQVPPGHLDHIPSYGLWRIVEYQTPPKQYAPLLWETIRAFKPAPSGEKDRK